MLPSIHEATGLIKVAYACLGFFWIGYPLYTIVHCAQKPDISKSKKTGWILFMIFGFIALNAGALLYGLLTFKGYRKLIPVAILAILISIAAFTQ